MRQLWINNKRMDSIARLQQEFASAEPSSTVRMCAQILMQCKPDGSLLDWLMRQPEQFLPGSTEIPVDKDTIKALTAALKDAAEAPVDTGLLSRLCGIDAQCFCSADLPSDEHDKKFELLSKQPWWPQAQELLTRVQDWGRVVTESHQLEGLLMNCSIPKQNESLPPLTVYLCNTGSVFYFNPTIRTRPVCFIGYGNPEIRLDPNQIYDDIDMKSLHLQFEDLTLRNSYGLKWKAWNEQTRNCILLSEEE